MFVSLLLIVETVAGNSQLSRVVRFDPQNMLSGDTKEVLKEETVVCVRGGVHLEGGGGRYRDDHRNRGLLQYKGRSNVCIKGCSFSCSSC